MSELAIDKSALVSIGLPTYNRAGTLRQAIASALTQSHKNLELIISDNASTDETEAICREFSAADDRVKYIRLAKNLGPTPNFALVLEESRGDYFMWLCDDDWLDPTYVEECLEVLIRDSGTFLAGGMAKYYEAGIYKYSGAITNLVQECNVDRMLTYYDTIVDNGIYYGLWRRADISRLPMTNTMGNDWLTLAAAAYSGKIRTVQNACIHRDLGGSTVSFAAIAEQMELPFLERHFPYISIGLNAVRDILARDLTFSQLSLAKRLLLATQVFGLIVTKYAIRQRIVVLLVGLKSRVLRRQRPQ